MIKLDHNRSCPWVQIAQVTKAQLSFCGVGESFKLTHTSWWKTSRSITTRAKTSESQSNASPTEVHPGVLRGRKEFQVNTHFLVENVTVHYDSGAGWGKASSELAHAST